MAKRARSAPERLFVDSSVWLAYLSARDGRHQDADRLVREAVRSKARLFTSNLVLAEVHRLLLHRAGIRPAAVALTSVSSSPSVEVLFPDLAVHRDAAAWIARFDDQVITYTDATSFVLMRARRCRAALSFDSDFLVAGYELWAP
ncbi:MAG: PIN domain-containing protein [Myxococcota bacterium]